MSFVIFIIGRPGSGKSEIRDSIMTTVSNLDPNLKICSIDELDILYDMKDSFPKEKISKNEEGHLILNDRSLFADIMLNMRKRLLDAISTNDLLLFEFSRAQYSNILAQLINDVPQSYMILYVDTPYTICLDRNEKRKSDKDHKYVPQSVIESFYKTDDVSELKQQFIKHIHIMDNTGDQKDDLHKKVIDLVKASIIPRFSTRYLIFKNSITGGEIVVATLMAGYVFLFLMLGRCMILYDPAGAGIRHDLTSTWHLFGIAIAGGGLGSTLYCIRSFYSYYIDGLFNFKKYRWWYLFRPIIGVILAIAILALAKSQVIVLTKEPIQETVESQLTIFAISFLAGFGTEQVVEKLRKAAKALFGEEEDKGKKAPAQ